MRKGAGEEEADAAGVAHDDGADLEQTTAQDPDLSAGEFGTGQTDGAQSLHQHVGERGEQQAELIGPPQMATGAIGEQVGGVNYLGRSASIILAGEARSL